jgi:chlorite dismutase
VALIGPELYPLSAIVERMRKTKQTSQYLESLGPFFVGKAIWQNQ